MTNITPADWTIGYCSNVHAGVDLATIRENLQRFSVPVRTSVGLEELGIGLWLPASAAQELMGDTRGFANFLTGQGLCVYTINGFPYENFHDDVVKHRVYKPTWCQQERLQYTKMLAHILAQLLPESEAFGSISTLPIGWPETETGSRVSREFDLAGANFRELAAELQQIEMSTGKRIVVAIEPEPGCQLEKTEDVVQFFETQFTEPQHRRYLTICHDVCHSAVMMEKQADVLAALGRAEIAIGKVQVSSAVVADWQSMAVERRREAMEQLAQFAEDRYLHQTGRRLENGDYTLEEDLPELIRQASVEHTTSGDPAGGDQCWVVHFHVPVFLERFGHLTTSQRDIVECLKCLAKTTPCVDFLGHLEVETYAWTVLPDAMRKRGLAEDIASELRWLQNTITEIL